MKMREHKWLGLFLIVLASVAAIVGNTLLKTRGRTLLEFDIQQDRELILLSQYAEPPQFAIWLENPETGELKTVFVTYRSAQGDWEGKVECPGSLPLWFEVFKREYQVARLPGMRETVVPDGITGATPQAGHFKVRVEVPPGSEWICWIEVNLAGDFNQYFDGMSGNANAIVDDSGQPSIIYRAKITSENGAVILPEIAGQVDITEDFEQMIQPIDGITTAAKIFKEIKARVVRPKPVLFKWSDKYKEPLKNLEEGAE